MVLKIAAALFILHAVPSFAQVPAAGLTRIGAAAAVKGSKSVIASATAANADELRKAAEENEHALAVTGKSLDEVAAVSGKLREAGFTNLVLEFQTQSSLAGQFQHNSIARRAALKDSFKPFGHATLHFIEGGTAYLKNPLPDESSAYS